MKTCQFPVRFSVTAKSTPTRLRKISDRFCADAIDPIRYRCRGCGLVWDDSPLRYYEDVVCSNCYSERVMLVRVRLAFENWGAQNGGKVDQADRLHLAVRAARRIDNASLGQVSGRERSKGKKKGI